MKNILKHYVIALAAGAFMLNVIAGKDVTIVNKTNDRLYVALTRTANTKKALSNPWELYSNLAQGEYNTRFFMKDGQPVFLEPGQYMDLEQFPVAKRTVSSLGATVYDRSLWVASNGQNLHAAIRKGKIEDKKEVQAFVIGDKTKVLILGKKGAYKIDTSDSAYNKAFSSSKNRPEDANADGRMYTNTSAYTP